MEPSDRSKLGLFPRPGNVSLFYETKKSSIVRGHDIDILRPSTMTLLYCLTCKVTHTLLILTLYLYFTYTLLILILRHLGHAAEKRKPRNSPRLHVAFIDFSQAYDTVPRQQLWSHLCRSAMPSTLLSVIKHMYENDKYILMDGEKRARASHEWCQTGVLSVPPPFLFVHQWHG